ncbi:MAG TPA: hypothetical protein DCL41_09015 [Bdellovibrionales bacterium]|nr:hypothetical protein [Pseudobdellovibrionaceae bacterium]HAG92000.1 hypothetical protein [Bdellovibrionales bacterium]|tara:strand:- start:1331 stop:1807 length:477 start_codon:yes stop_codon:yes gene_type:complete
MESIFQVLKKDHDLQREILNDLVDENLSAARRDELYERLRFEIKRHSKFEEKYFYRVLMKDERTRNHVRQCVSDHHVMTEILEDLDSLSRESNGWRMKVKTLRDIFSHHLDREEKSLFEKAKEVLDPAQMSQMANRFRFGSPNEIELFGLASFNIFGK